MKLTDKKILVIGGAGNIGSHVVDKLVGQENKVTVLDDFSVGARWKIEHHGDKIDIIEGDVLERDLMQDIVKGYDVVFYLACKVLRATFAKTPLVYDVCSTGNVNCIEACRVNGIDNYVYISSSEAYGTAIKVPMKEDEHPYLPNTTYAAAKAAGELVTMSYRKQFGMNTTVVRPFNTYGPRCDVAGIYGTVIPKFLIRALNDKEPVIFGDGTATRDYTYIKDTAAGIVAAAEHADVLKNKPVNISHGEEVTVNEIAELVLDITGKKLTPRHTDPRPADTLRHWGCNERAKELLGFTAKTSIREGIVMYMDWLLEQEKKTPGYLKKLDESIIERNWA